MLTDPDAAAAPDAGAVAEAEVWLRQLRSEADRAAHARVVGSEAMEVAARAAGRRIIERITVLLLQQHLTSPAGPLSEAISAACTAELARLEGRNEAWRWRLAARHWERAGRPDETEAARRQADADRRTE